MVRRDGASTVASDHAGAAARAGVDPTLEGRARDETLRREIVTRRGVCYSDAAGYAARSNCSQVGVAHEEAGARAPASRISDGGLVRR